MSTPTPTDLLGEIYAHWIAELGLLGDAPVSTELLRLIFDDWHRATAEPEDVTYATTALGGVRGIMVTPLGADPAQIMLFFHGGGFALGSASSHRKLAGHIAKACGITAFVLDFRLAPDFKFPAQLEDGVAVYRAVLERGISADDITLIGDSAGANLAISTVFELRAADLPAPSGVVTISPWLNMENNGQTIDTNDATDFLIAREGLQGNIDRYIAGATEPTDPRANPLYRTYEGFPRLYITAGDIESLWDNATGLDRLARSAGVDVTFSTGEGMQHVYPFMAGNHPRADQEVAAIGEWYRSGRPSTAHTAHSTEAR